MTDDNPALKRHTDLKEQIKWLQEQIKESTKGAVNPADEKFKYRQFTEKWNQGKLSGKQKEIMSMLRTLSLPGKVSAGLENFGFTQLQDSRKIDARYNVKDPKSVYRFLVKEIQKTERYLGARNKRDRGILAGISGDGPGSILRIMDTNDRYVREFDPLIQEAYDLQAKQAEADYKRSTTDWHLDPDAWRLELPLDNPHRTKTESGSPLPNQRAKLALGDVTTINKGKRTERQIRNISRPGGGFYSRNDNVLTADGRSTSLSINTSDRRWGNADPGEMLGVMPRRLREQYDREVLKIGK